MKVSRYITSPFWQQHRRVWVLSCISSSSCSSALALVTVDGLCRQGRCCWILAPAPTTLSKTATGLQVSIADLKNPLLGQPRLALTEQRWQYESVCVSRYLCLLNHLHCCHFLHHSHYWSSNSDRSIFLSGYWRFTSVNVVEYTTQSPEIRALAGVWSLKNLWKTVSWRSIESFPCAVKVLLAISSFSFLRYRKQDKEIHHSECHYHLEGPWQEWEKEKSFMQLWNEISEDQQAA